MKAEGQGEEGEGQGQGGRRRSTGRRRPRRPLPAERGASTPRPVGSRSLKVGRSRHGRRSDVHQKGEPFERDMYYIPDRILRGGSVP